jgi:hypothetical protein
MALQLWSDAYAGPEGLMSDFESEMEGLNGCISPGLAMNEFEENDE